MLSLSGTRQGGDNRSCTHRKRRPPPPSGEGNRHPRPPSRRDLVLATGPRAVRRLAQMAPRTRQSADRQGLAQPEVCSRVIHIADDGRNRAPRDGSCDLAVEIAPRQGARSDAARHDHVMFRSACDHLIRGVAADPGRHLLRKWRPASAEIDTLRCWGDSVEGHARALHRLQLQSKRPAVVPSSQSSWSSPSTARRSTCVATNTGEHAA